MIDELDLAFADDQIDRTRPRHRRGRGGKKSSGRSGVAFLMAFILLAVLGGGVYFGYTKVRGYFTAADYDGAGGDPISVTIAKGATLTDMGDTLVDSDVVKSTKAFVQAAAKNPKSSSIQSGSYNLRKQMSAESAITLLLDPKARLSKGVTIPEGKTANQVYDILAKATGKPVAEFKAAGKDVGALGLEDYWFKRDDGQKVTKSVEGFLFPDTYEFDPKASAVDDLKLMVNHFLTVAGDMQFADKSQSDRHITPYEVLTVASLAQAEAGNSADLGKVARVAYNRLYGTGFHCKCLEFDVGINYYYQLTGRPTKSSGQMTTAELRDPKNPYRLHGKEGLTPTPINNPGKAALQGALSPPAGNWLFFVAIDKKGHSAFTADYAQQQKNEALARRNGVL